MPIPACGSRCTCEGASSEAEVSPRAWKNPLERGVSPRARRNPLEGAVSPRARRNLLEGAFDWAAPVGRGDHCSVGRAVCACSGKRCILFSFFAGFKQDSPGFLGDPQGCPRQWRILCSNRGDFEGGGVVVDQGVFRRARGSC
jgi:hypothetical protein